MNVEASIVNNALVCIGFIANVFPNKEIDHTEFLFLLMPHEKLEANEHNNSRSR